jgi:hypothetical protein
MRHATVKPNSWKFHSLEDVGRFWREVRTVPMRAEGRRHHHEEQYAVGLYLLLLRRHGLLSYPFHLDEAESPDFMLTWPSTETSGLEVTRATTQPFQKVMSDIDREYVRRKKTARAEGTEAEPVSVIYNPLGWTDGQCVRNWCDQVLEATIRKLGKLAEFRQAAHHDLLIYNDADVPLFPGREREQTFDTVASELKRLESRYAQSFRSISVLMSLDVEYDVGRNRQLLVYRESEAS